MTARLMTIGLDGAEATLLADWAAEGILPNLARLYEDSAGWSLERDNPMDTLPGALWPQINSGQSVARFGHYNHPRQLRSGEVHRRPVNEDEVDADSFYWSIAGKAGHKVAIIEVPYMVLNPRLNGLQLMQWGAHHPSHFTMASWPAALAGEMCSHHGMHPITDKAAGRCDRYPKTTQGYSELLDDLLEGIRRRTAILLDIMARDRWDLFACSISEMHCAGHHFWHFHDSSHYLHDPSAPQRFKDAVRTVYVAADAAIGKLVEAAGRDCVVLTFAPQGMRCLTGGQQLMEEVVVRLGMSSGGAGARQSLIRRVQTVIKRNAPLSFYPLLRRLGHAGPLRALQNRSGCLLDPWESPHTRAASVQNNAVGAVRLNLKGRDPHGSVEPGEQAKALLDQLSAGFAELVDPRSGERIVKTLLRADEMFGAEHHPDLPDLLVEFRDDLGLIEACRSDRIGEIRLPLGKLLGERTGDHNSHSYLWAKGPGIRAGVHGDEASVLDIAPTVLRLMEVPLPNTIDGQPLPVH